VLKYPEVIATDIGIARIHTFGQWGDAGKTSRDEIGRAHV